MRGAAPESRASEFTAEALRGTLNVYRSCARR